MQRNRYLSIGKGNLVFCCTGSWENYVGLFGWQNNINNPQLKGWPSKNKNIDH